jgi:hypothetical protein
MQTTGGEQHALKLCKTGALLGIMFALFAIVGAMEKQNTIKAMEQYCDLVYINRVDKEVGWPDYKNVFVEQCTPEGKLRPMFYE